MRFSPCTVRSTGDRFRIENGEVLYLGKGEVQTFDWTVVIVASVGALAGQFAITRYWPAIVRILTATPPPDQKIRGRGV